MGKMQRTKGKVGEQEIVNLLKANGLYTKRISMMETGGIDKGDIKIEDTTVKGKIGSVKRGQHVPVFLYKSLADADYLFCRRDKQKWIVTMTLDSFIDIMKKGGKQNDL